VERISLTLLRDKFPVGSGGGASAPPVFFRGIFWLAGDLGKEPLQVVAGDFVQALGLEHRQDVQPQYLLVFDHARFLQVHPGIFFQPPLRVIADRRHLVPVGEESNVAQGEFCLQYALHLLRRGAARVLL